MPGDLFSLAGKVSLITGGSRGLGLATAFALAEFGSDVCLCDLNQPDEEVLAALERFGVKVIFVKADVANEKDVDAVMEEVEAHFGRLDVAINNAGVGDASPVLETNLEMWDRVQAVNLRGVLICAQREARLMRRQGGVIVNVASISGMIVNREVALAAYAASKAGVIQLTRSLAAELAPLDIRVNCISPGYIATEMNRKNMENTEVYNSILTQIPIKRFGEPREVAAAVVFLVCPASQFMTGMNLVVDGGYTTW